jgi:hypothetical protein
MLIPLCVNYLPVEWCKLNSKQNLYPRAAILRREGGMVDLWPQRWWLSVQFAWIPCNSYSNQRIGWGV